jgi:hypothetical protein
MLFGGVDMSRNRFAGRDRGVSLLIVVVTMALQALAYGFAGGAGQPRDPYQVATAAELMSIGSDPNR